MIKTQILPESFSHHQERKREREMQIKTMYYYGDPCMEAPLWDLIPKMAASRCQEDRPYSVVLSPELCPSKESTGRRVMD